MSGPLDLSEDLTTLRHLASASDLDGRLLETALRLVESDPMDGLWIVWNELWGGANDDLRRTAAFVTARSAERTGNYIWPVISSFLSSPTVSDQSTLINIVTAIQLSDSDTALARSVLSVDLNSFLLRCILSSGPAAQAGADLTIRLSDLGTLPEVLSKDQARHLNDVAKAVDSIRDRHSDLEQCLKPDRFDAIQKFDETALEKPYELPELAQLESAWTGAVRMAREAAVGTLQDLMSAWKLGHENESDLGMFQQLRLTGSGVTSGKVALSTLEGVLRAWHKLFETAYAFARIGTTTPEAPSPRMFALAPQAGSYVVRLFVEHVPGDPVIGTAFDDSVRLAEGRSTQTGMENDTDAVSAVGILHNVLESENVDLTLEMADRLLAIPTARSRFSKRTMAHVIGATKVGLTDEIQEKIVGILEGANHRTGRIEVRPPDKLDTIHCDTPMSSREILVSKVIGRTYFFTLLKTIGHRQLGDAPIKWTVLRIDGLEIESSSSEEVGAWGWSVKDPVSSDHIPQQDSLSRVIQVVGLMATGTSTTPANMGMKHGNEKERKNSERHIDYMKHAAKVLGLVSDAGALLAAGQTLTLLSDRKKMAFLAIQFQSSMVGRSWLDWAKVSEIEDLDPASSEEFLRKRAVRGPGKDGGLPLSDSMIERRGRTLRRWTHDLQEGLAAKQESVANVADKGSEDRGSRPARMPSEHGSSRAKRGRDAKRRTR